MRSDNDIARVFPFSARYDPEIPRARRRLVWERYWRYLETIHIDEGSDLALYFVGDEFQGGRVMCRSLSLIKGELRLSIDNTQAMNRIHELRGDKWACSHISRSDFSTRVIFRGVEFFDLRLGTTQRKRYYRFSEVAARGRHCQIILYLTDTADADAYLWVSFDTVSVEDISCRMKKYEKMGHIKIALARQKVQGEAAGFGLD